MKKILIVLLVVGFLSCSSDDVDQNPDYVEIFGISDFTQAKEELGVYVNFGIWANGVVHLESVKSRIFEPSGNFIFNFSDDSDDFIDGGKLTFGKLTSEYDPAKGYYVIKGYENANAEELGILVDGMLGKATTFNLEREGRTVFNETLYLPPAMEVVDFSTSGQIEGSNSYLISRNNFHFSWPSDVNNENGILVVLTWSGEMLNKTLGENITPQYEYRIAKIDDIGSATLPLDFFEGLPKEAMVFLYFYRGNAEYFLGPDKFTYKIGVFNYEQIGAVLED